MDNNSYSNNNEKFTNLTNNYNMNKENNKNKNRSSSLNSNNNYMQFLNFDNDSSISGGTNENKNTPNSNGNGNLNSNGNVNSLKSNDFFQQKMFEDFMMKQNNTNSGIPMNLIDMPESVGSLLGLIDSPAGNSITSSQIPNFINNGIVPNMSTSNSLLKNSNDQFQLSGNLEMPMDINFSPSPEQEAHNQQQQQLMLSRAIANDINNNLNNLKIESPKSFHMSGFSDNFTSNNNNQEDLLEYPHVDHSVENHFENLPPLNTVSANDQNYWRSCIAFVENVAFGKDPEFSKADFIREQDKVIETTTLGDTDYEDYIKVPEQGHPYNIVLGDLPANSRVETQIKLQINIEPAPVQNIIHLSTNGIPRRKYMLQKPVHQWKENLLQHVLFLETHIIKTSDKKRASVCDKCCKREERRFSRRKSGNTDADLWAVNDSKEALIFNTKQLCVLNNSNVDLKSQKSLKNVTIPCRFVCYCRHHKETIGFKIVVLLKNCLGDILAKKTSQPLKIINYNAKSKAIKDTASDVSDTASSVASESSYATDYSNSRQSSVDYNSTSSYQSEMDNMPLSADQIRNKRVINSLKTTTADLLQHTSPGSSSANLNAEVLHQQQQQQQNHQQQPHSSLAMQTRGSSSQSPEFQQQQQQQQKNMTPLIHKIIPNSGPLCGGVEVTILGENFNPDTQVRFGINKALTVNFWGPTTIVATAPPTSFPGPVQVVGLTNDIDIGSNVPTNADTVFTYIEQNDKELLELALQIVDLEVNGNNNNSNNNVNGGASDSSFTSDAQSLAKKLILEKQQQQQQRSQPSTHESKTTSDTTLQPYKVVLSLLDTGKPIKNLNLKNKNGHTLLHLASLRSHIELVIFLISNGANVNAGDKFGFTPLHFACLANDIRIIKMFIAMNCDKYSPTFTRDLMTPLELFLNNYNSETSQNYDEINELLKEEKRYPSSFLDNDSVCSDGSGYQAHISTMVTDDSLFNKNAVLQSKDTHSNKYLASLEWKQIEKESSVAKSVTKVSGNGSTTSGVTVNDACNISIDSQPPLYDDLFPTAVLKRPNEEFKELTGKKLSELQMPLLSLSNNNNSLLPAIDHSSLRVDEIDTTDMEEQIISVGSYNNSGNETADTELYNNNELLCIENGEKKKSILNPFNEDLLNNFKLMKDKQKDFFMDTKLLFFWIPFLFILVSTVIILSLSSTDENSFTDSWNIASNSVRTKLANLFIGRQRWQGFVKDAIHQGEIKFKEAFSTEPIQSII